MLDAHSALVAFTRLTKGSYRLYATSDDVERLNERLGLERLKETVLDAGLKDVPKTERQILAQPSPATRPQRPAAQRTTLQVKLDDLINEHKELKQAGGPMSESGRKALHLLEVFERPRKQAHPLPASPTQTPRMRQGLGR